MDDLLGRGWCWQPVKAHFSGWLAVPELSDYFRERCFSLPLCSFFLWVMMASSGFSTGQRATTVRPEIWLHSCVPCDCFLTSNDFVGPLSELEWWNVCFLCNPRSRRSIKKMNWIYPQISPQIRRHTSSKRHRRRQSISSACACRLSLAAARLSSSLWHKGQPQSKVSKTPHLSVFNRLVFVVTPLISRWILQTSLSGEESPVPVLFKRKSDFWSTLN